MVGLTAARDACYDFLAACDLGEAHALSHPLDWMDWTRRQREYQALVSVALYTLFRAGNQIGKTIVGAALTIWACLGFHPDGALTRPPIEAWVICTSWSQSVAVMSKVWELVPKDEVLGARFRQKDGFGKDNPVLQFINGSIIRFKTTGQGAEALASATIHWVWIDEPTDESIYRELQKRVRKHRGRVIVTLTPVNRDCGWLKELVDRGAVKEVHARLDADSLTFIGSGERLTLADGSPMDDAWIETETEATPSMFVPVVIHGEWETRPEGVFFACYDPSTHLRPPPKWGATVKRYFALGIDYASADREFGQVAILAEIGEKKVADSRFSDWSVYVHDEVFSPGSTTIDDFAEDVVEMLGRNGLQWHQIGRVFGDLPSRSRFDVKSNILMQRQIGRVIKVPYRSVRPAIMGAKDGQRSSGARDIGCRWLYGLLAKRRLLLNPRCVELARCLATWDYSSDHPRKDGIDALRYACKLGIFPFGSSVSAAPTIRTR